MTWHDFILDTRGATTQWYIVLNMWLVFSSAVSFSPLPKRQKLLLPFQWWGNWDSEVSRRCNDLPKGMIKSYRAVNNPGPWIPNPLSTIYPCGGQKESRFPNSPTGKMYLGSSLWAQFPHLCPPWRGWQRALRGWSNLVLSFGLQFEQQDKEMSQGRCSGIIPVASRGPVLSVCLSCLSHNPYSAFPHCLLSPSQPPPLCPHPAVDWL